MPVRGVGTLYTGLGYNIATKQDLSGVFTFMPLLFVCVFFCFVFFCFFLIPFLPLVLPLVFVCPAKPLAFLGLLMGMLFEGGQVLLLAVIKRSDRVLAYSLKA